MAEQSQASVLEKLSLEIGKFDLREITSHYVRKFS